MPRQADRWLCGCCRPATGMPHLRWLNEPCHFARWPLLADDEANGNVHLIPDNLGSNLEQLDLIACLASSLCSHLIITTCRSPLTAIFYTPSSRIASTLPPAPCFRHQSQQSSNPPNFFRRLPTCNTVHWPCRNASTRQFQRPPTTLVPVKLYCMSIFSAHSPTRTEYSPCPSSNATPIHSASLSAGVYLGP